MERPPPTILELLRTISSYLEERGVESPRRTAEWFLSEQLGIPRLELYLRFEETVPAERLEPLREMVRRRVRGEPTQYIVGSVEFCGHRLRVDRRALIPRPETEILVERVLERIPADASGWVIDVGTGCGALAAALALARPRIRVAATDSSEEALALAAENLRDHGLEERVRPIRGDLLTFLREGSREVLAIVSNPPYVRTGELSGLAREIRDFEPRAALDGGEDGLEAYRRMIPAAARILVEGGFAAFEVGAGQSAAVESMLREAGFPRVERTRDYAGVERVVTAVR